MPGRMALSPSVSRASRLLTSDRNAGRLLAIEASRPERSDCSRLAVEVEHRDVLEIAQDLTGARALELGIGCDRKIGLGNRVIFVQEPASHPARRGHAPWAS